MKNLSIRDAAELYELRISAERDGQTICVVDPSDWQAVAIMGTGPIEVKPEEDPILDIIKNFESYGPSLMMSTSR